MSPAAVEEDPTDAPLDDSSTVEYSSALDDSTASVLLDVAGPVL